jgi:hypothetical protein
MDSMSPEAIDISRLTACLPTEALENIPEVLATMNNVEAELACAGLTQVTHFNRIYKELTGTVQHGIDQGEMFQQPDTVRRTVGIFAQLYFDPLRAYAEGDRDAIPAAWRQLFCDPTAKTAPSGIQFLLGMNAHINYDLPQALNTSRVDEDYYPDYRTVVGALIGATAQKLSSSYLEIPGIGRDLLTAGTVYKIAQWREKAWHAGNALQLARDDERATDKILKNLDRSAERKGRWILPIGSFALNALGLPKRLGLAVQETGE